MLKLVAIAVAISVVIGLPVENPIGDQVLENEGMYQGDIAGVDPYSDRNAIADLTKLWPNGKIYYQIDPSADNITTIIHQAMKQYKDKTGGCIEFINSKGDGNYINIYRGDGCWSLVGRQGNGKQAVSLGVGCQFVGTAVHELGHAIGFWHEQNRSDRDNYIDVHLENVKPAMRYNFDKLTPSQNLLLVPYDYNSIMEYAEYAFSVDKQKKKTIVPKKAGVTITPVWTRPGLDDNDVIAIKKLYECDGYKRPAPKMRKDYFTNFTNGWGWVRDAGRSAKQFKRVQVEGNWVIEADSAYIGKGWVRFLTDYVQVKDETKGCLSFKYKITGPGIRSIELALQEGKTIQTAWKPPPITTATGWETLRVSFKTIMDPRFFMTVICDANQTGKLYFDDIKYHFGDCQFTDSL
ncbi:Astacin-like metalloprotease toxin 1 [Nymphon striatum]|nr:Astacin-like metalloprotease toxin 1 [Nymphon striatum]